MTDIASASEPGAGPLNRSIAGSLDASAMKAASERVQGLSKTTPSDRVTVGREAPSAVTSATRSSRLSRVTMTLEARIDGLGFQGEYGEDALVHAVEGLPTHEPLQRFDAERELALGERALVTKAPFS